jgi:hypothetical protein
MRTTCLITPAAAMPSIRTVLPGALIAPLTVTSDDWPLAIRFTAFAEFSVTAPDQGRWAAVTAPSTSTAPSGSSIVPPTTTCGASSATNPPRPALIVPSIVMTASGSPGALKLFDPKSAGNANPAVDKTTPPIVSICAPGLTVIPLLSTRMTRPFDWIVPPAIWAGPPFAWISSTDVLVGWVIVTVLFASRLKV